MRLTIAVCDRCTKRSDPYKTSEQDHYELPINWTQATITPYGRNVLCDDCSEAHADWFQNQANLGSGR